MKAIRGQSTKIVCLVSMFVVILSGCTVGGKSFSIDSNSRVPFFGLELRERNRKSSAPAYQSISRTKETNAEIRIAMQGRPTTPSVRVTRPESRSVSIGPVQVTRPPREETAKTKSLADKGSLAIPLTKAADSRKAPGLSVASDNVDFQ